MIDQDTFNRYQVTEAAAKEFGLALIEALDHRELLLTKKRQHDLEVAALEELIRRFGRQSPNKLMSYYFGRVDGTAAEMFSAVKQWLDTVMQNYANKTLGDM